MGEWIKSLAVICPEHLCDDANHLAACVGVSLQDFYTFNYCGWEDSLGNKYSVIQTLLKQAGEDKLSGQLVRPDFDVAMAIDLVKASNAQSKMTFIHNDIENKITCSYSMGLRDLAISCGLTQIEEVIE